MLKQNNLVEATTEQGFPTEVGLPVQREVKLEDGTKVIVESVVPEVMAQTLKSHFVTPGEKYMDNGLNLNGVVQNYNGDEPGPSPEPTGGFTETQNIYIDGYSDPAGYVTMTIGPGWDSNMEFDITYEFKAFDKKISNDHMILEPNKSRTVNERSTGPYTRDTLIDGLNNEASSFIEVTAESLTIEHSIIIDNVGCGKITAFADENTMSRGSGLVTFTIDNTTEDKTLIIKAGGLYESSSTLDPNSAFSPSFTMENVTEETINAKIDEILSFLYIIGYKNLLYKYDGSGEILCTITGWASEKAISTGSGVISFEIYNSSYNTLRIEDGIIGDGIIVSSYTTYSADYSDVEPTEENIDLKLNALVDGISIIEQ